MTLYVREQIRSEYVIWAAKVGRWDNKYWPSTVPIQSYSKILATHHRGIINNDIVGRGKGRLENKYLYWCPYKYKYDLFDYKYMK